MFTRREFLPCVVGLPFALGAMISSTMGALFAGCGGGASFSLTVGPEHDDASVFVATSAFYNLGIEVRRWENPVLAGQRKVVTIDGMRSENWVFEINGRRFDGSADAAAQTRVFEGQVITWFEV